MKVPTRFEEVRAGFLKQHKHDIQDAVQHCFEGTICIDPVPVACQVKEQFLKAWSNSAGAELRPAFHGTDIANYTSIFQHGLLIPGRGNQLQVSHGSAHGLGIYTADFDNSWLSRMFCSVPRMLVCGVLDDAVELVQPRHCGRLSVSSESETVRHVGGAVVVFDPGRVVPLFEVSAQGFASGGPKIRVAAPNSNGPQNSMIMRSGTRQILFCPTGVVAFVPPCALCDPHAIRRKRILEQRLRHATRISLRAAKMNFNSL